MLLAVGLRVAYGFVINPGSIISNSWQQNLLNLGLIPVGIIAIFGGIKLTINAFKAKK